MSPYENRHHLDGYYRVTLVAFIRPGAESLITEAMNDRPADLKELLGSVGIRNLNLFTATACGHNNLFAYFDFKSDGVESAQDTLLGASPWFETLTPHLDPHPRAPGGNRPWLRTEMMNIAGAEGPKGPGGMERIGLVALLKPDNELPYRTLHQTNWPGVVDTMIRCNYRNWTTFLFEVGKALILFTYFEYVGTDRKADDELMAQDPVTQRWWRHTQPCLASPGLDDGPWVATSKLLSSE